VQSQRIRIFTSLNIMQLRRGFGVIYGHLEGPPTGSSGRPTGGGWRPGAGGGEWVPSGDGPAVASHVPAVAFVFAAGRFQVH
jgi:hypothetical protein